MNWIIKREILIKSFFVDIVILSLIIYFSKEKFYLDLSFINLIVMFLAWVILSYIFDRYYDYVKYKYLSLINCIGINFLKTLGISISVICSLKFLKFLNLDSGHLHIYNFYFIFYLSFFSTLLNYLLSFLYSGKTSKEEIWIFVGSKEKLVKFRKEERLINSNIIIKGFSKSKLSNPFNFSYKGIIVDSTFKLEKNIVSLLIELKNKGVNLVNLEYWCRKFLERYPIDLIGDELFTQDLGIYKFSIQFRIKRLGDIIFGGFLMFLSIPIVLICSILIYLEDRGPVFYKQIRTGQYEKTFEIIKLRTMKVNAEDSGPQWSKTGDKRITKLGKILRLTRIDELPQLICVLKGEMSLIGPRPERPEIDEKLKKEIPNYSLRYIIRPGLSGWAQVNIPYGASISDSIMKFSYDIYYLKNTSMFLDFLICIRTIRMVFNARGAMPSKKY